METALTVLVWLVVAMVGTALAIFIVAAVIATIKAISTKRIQKRMRRNAGF